MYAVDWKAVIGLIPMTLLCRTKDLKSDVVSRMTLSGTDTNFKYHVAALSMTAHAVQGESKLEPRLGARINHSQ